MSESYGRNIAIARALGVLSPYSISTTSPGAGAAAMALRARAHVEEHYAQERVAALLELGMGFHPDFTGRQNAVMAAQLLGLQAQRFGQGGGFVVLHVADYDP